MLEKRRVVGFNQVDAIVMSSAGGRAGRPTRSTTTIHFVCDEFK